MSRTESNRLYDRYARDKRSKAFYQSKEWKKLRDIAYNRDHGLCQRCLKDKKIVRADVVHHIIEIKTDWEQRLVLDNLESICHACHNKEHSGTKTPQRRIRVIRG